MYFLLGLAILVLIIYIVVVVLAFAEDINDGFMFLIVGIVIAGFIDLIILSPVLVIDKRTGTTLGTITSVDRNFFGSTAIYIKTSETEQEKYCAENEEIIGKAKDYIGKKVKIEYGTRVGLYRLEQCDQAPIDKIELIEEVKKMNEKIKFDHFKNIEELLHHIDIWYKEDDIDYTRWFGLNDLYTLSNYITNLQQENTQLKEDKKKAIEYIKEHTDKLKTTRVPKIDFNYKELLEILGDKEKY